MLNCSLKLAALQEVSAFELRNSIYTCYASAVAIMVASRGEKESLWRLCAFDTGNTFIQTVLAEGASNGACTKERLHSGAV